MKQIVDFGFVVVFLILMSSSANAHKDKYFLPTTVEWKIAPSESCFISTSVEGELREIHYLWNDLKLIVPRPEIEGIGQVDLRDVEVLGADQSSIGSYRYIKIGMGSRYCGSTAKGCADDVRFIFREANYESRSIYRKVNETTTQIYNKYPGQIEQPGGQVELLQ